MTDRTRLPVLPLLCYSVGNVPATAIYSFLGAFLLKFYTDYLQIDPALVGWAFLVRSLIDVLIDPIIGYWSDRTRSPRGRRRPFFLVGTIPAAIFFCLTLTPPTGSQYATFYYLVLISTLSVCFLSVMAITHLALGFELTDDYHERTRIFGYKNFIENLTTLLATFSVPLACQLDGSQILGRHVTRTDCYLLAAIGLAVISAVSAIVAYAGTSETPREQHESEYGFVEGIVGALRNPAFRLIAIIFSLITIADRIVMGELFIIVERLHGIREEDSVGLLAGYFAGALFSVWGWVWLAQRFGKARILRVAIAAWPLSCGLLVACAWTEPVLCVIAFCMGTFGTGMVTILGAMVPDVLEHERLRSGQRREGMYVSVGNVICQLALGIGFVIAGQTLSWIGYQGERETSPKLLDHLRLSFALVPLGLCGLALIMTTFDPWAGRGSHIEGVSEMEHVEQNR